VTADAEGRRALAEAAARLFAAGVMSASGHGNLSARLEGERMLLTAGGTIDELGPDDLAIVGFDGHDEDGRLEPSAREIVGMHAVVYRERPEAGAVIHTHSPFLTAFAVAGRRLPCRYEALLRFGQAEDVPIVPWAPRGSPESVTAIAGALRAWPASSAVLLGNHGLLAFGPDAGAAAMLVVALEEGAQAEWRAAVLGGSVPFPAGALDAVRAAMAAAGTRC
jgi:L-ribulose-5-phosphate 4-epimerase